MLGEFDERMENASSMLKLCEQVESTRGGWNDSLPAMIRVAL